MQEIIYTNHVEEAIDSAVEHLDPTNVVVLVDSNTSEAVLPRMQAESKAVAGAKVIETRPGDENKGINSLTHIWTELSESGCTRRSLLINLGGGVVTDMGAFAASTFKRGIMFINVPTTLLAAVDAAVGGKTGINFNGFKNEIGAFREADQVIISTTFFKTLNHTELLSGYAEMLKHALISSEAQYRRLLAFDVTSQDWDRLLELLRESVEVKREIVRTDPTEKGIRRALNFGHTAGHAFEELALDRKSAVPHGYAVAFGMIVELVLSNMEAGFPSDELHRYAQYVRGHYGTFAISCRDYDRLIEFMRHDKKNVTPDDINFTLISGVGAPEIDHIVNVDRIKAALDIYCDLMGL